MKILFLLIAMLFSLNASADFSHEDMVHLTAHAGASFALQTVFYGINSRCLGMNKPLSEGVALVETLAVGFIYKQTESDTTNSQVMRAMGENALGAAGAIGTHLVFHF